MFKKHLKSKEKILDVYLTSEIKEKKIKNRKLIKLVTMNKIN
jgi:hypothetical protein